MMNLPGSKLSEAEKKVWQQVTAATLEIITRYVQQNGTLLGASSQLPDRIAVLLTDAIMVEMLTPESKWYHEHFSRGIKKAKEAFESKRYDPSKDPEIRELTRRAFRQMIESGQSSVTTERDKHGQVIRTRETAKAGIPSWAYFRVFPKEERTIDQVRNTVAAMASFLYQSYSVQCKKEEMSVIESFLRAFLYNEADAIAEEGTTSQRDILSLTGGFMNRADAGEDSREVISVQYKAEGLYNPDDDDE